MPASVASPATAASTVDVPQPGRYVVPGPPPRPRSQLVGTGFAIAAGAMAVAGALGHYMARRHASGMDPGHEWLAGHSVPSPQLVYALITLGVSVVTAHWAVWASGRGARGHTWVGMAITLVMGFAFFNMVMFSLNRMEVELGSGRVGQPRVRGDRALVGHPDRRDVLPRPHDAPVAWRRRRPGPFNAAGRSGLLLGLRRTCVGSHLVRRVRGEVGDRWLASPADTSPVASRWPP